MSSYYRIYRDPQARRKGLTLHRVASLPSLGVYWLVGQAITKEVPTPIRCTLKAIDGAVLPDAFLDEKIPLFSEKFVNCLKLAGVTNIDCYPAQLVDASGMALPTRFYAVNIVGLVAAVDQAKSEKHPLSDYPMTEFARLVIDPEAARGCRLFRLADNPSFVIADDTVKRAMDEANLINVRALSLDDRSAY